MKNWARALALALVAHAAVVCVCWFGAQSARRRSRPPASDVVELETWPVSVPFEPAAAEVPAPAAAHVRRSTRARDGAPAPEPAASAVREPRPVRPAGEAPAASVANGEWGTNSPATRVAAPSLPPAPTPVTVPARALLPVDLQLKHDPTALAMGAPSPPLRPGEILDAPGLRGQVGRDGSIKIENKAPVHVTSDLTSPGSLLKDWLKDPKEHASGRDGTVQIVGGTFDATDAIMRATGQDPYRAQHMKMLDATREERLALAVRDRSTRQREELVALPARLRAIWGDGVRPARERRRLLFALWDECEEAAPNDDHRGSAGESAREMIIVFIRDHAAPEGPQAYGREELVALNAIRESRQRFEPYQSSRSRL